MKSSTLTCAAWSISLLAFLAALPAKAADLAYAGRLVDAEGAPLAGPVDITLRFYGSAAGSDQLGPTKTFDGVPLEGGVFQLTVALEATDQAAIFADGTAVVFVEVEAAGKRYPRQRFTPVPLALRIPVDNDSLVYGSDAKLAVGEIAIGQVQGLSAALAQKLDSTPASSAASGYLSAADWTTFNAKQAAITASTSLAAGSIATASQDAVVIKPYGTQAGETGELRFEEKTGGNYVGFKAPDSLAADKVWTLPAADGAAGELLATDGSGGLSWMALSGANILDATITDAKLQTITTAGKVSGAAITSGTIGGSAAFAGTGGVTTSGNITLSPASSAATQLRFQDDDASNYVAFKAPSTVASNLVLTLPAADGASGQFLRTDGAGTLTWGSPAGSGDMLASANLGDLTNAPTARNNLGLGALATLAAVGSAEITNGSLADADISASAAIATSKLSGALTAVAGHGLGALATASSVTSGEITDSTIVNADISTAAAIATSKLSGAVTSISGHGLGSLASLSSVTAAEIGDGEIADADISGSAAIATSKLSGPLTAVSGHGLGSLATLSTVGSAEITDSAVASADIADGTIVNTDISGTAAIATSKLSGSVTSISGHGLGALATLSTVSTSEITDGTIANADISGTAAIATTKLSGALTAVSGHGLGALATLSTVSAAEITDGTIADADISATASIDSSKIANGSVSSSEFQYLNGVTSSIQTQLDAKASAASPTFTGEIASALGSAAAPSYSFTGDSNTGVWSSGTDTVNVSTGGSERLRVTSAGNVGIGTTNPGNLLTVQSPTQFMGVQVRNATNRVAELVGGSAVNEGGLLALYNDASQNVSIRAQGASFFNGGNVGIGTTSPVSKLEVTDEATPASRGVTVSQHTTDIAAALLNLRKSRGTAASPTAVANGDYTASIGAQNYDGASWLTNGILGYRVTGAISSGNVPGQWIFAASAANDVNPSGNGTIRMVVGSDGNVGIGTTSPTETLAVAGNIALGPANNQYRYMSIGGGNSLGYIYGSYSGLGDGIHLGYNSYYSSAGSFVTRNAFASTRLSLGYNYISLATTNDYSGTGAPQARLTITDVGNVGIGTTAPLSLLAVNGGAAIGSYAGANSAPANSLIVSGKIGVGTTAPSTALEVAGTIRSTSGGIQFPDGTTMTTAGGGTVTNQTSTTNIAFASDTGVTNNSSYNISFSTAGAQRMVISNTGRVAIGNSNPQSALDVTGGVAIGSYAGSSAAPSNGLIVSGNVGIGTTSPVNALSVSGAANFTGNVGIGTTTSASPLAIRGSDTNSTVGQGAAAAFSIGNTDGTVGRTTEIQFMAPNGQVLSGLSSILGGYNSGTGGYWGDLAVFTKAAHSGNFPAEKVRITEAGNVGIGTTAPASKLSVNGGGSFVGSVGIGTTSPSNTLSVSGTANITGNVGIGTTSPTTALAIRTSGTNSTVGQAAAAAFSIGNTDGTVGRTTEIQLAAPSGQVLSGFSSIMGGYNSGTGGYWGDLGIFTKAAHSGTVPTEKIRITGSGSVGIGTTSPSYLLHVNGSVAGVGAYNQLSDERYKKDIDDISDSLEKVLAIHGVTYKWIDEERYGSETQIGVLAQEIEKIVPEVVTTGSDGVKRVRYSDLVPLLIEALKREHTNRDAEGAKKDIEIAQLKAKSEQLKGESEQLKAAFCSKFPEMPFCSR